MRQLACASSNRRRTNKPIRPRRAAAAASRCVERVYRLPGLDTRRTQSARARPSECHKRCIVADGWLILPQRRRLPDRLESRGCFRDKSSDVFERPRSRDQISLQVDIAAIRDKFKLGRPLDALGGYCLLYTSDAADDLLCVDLGGRRIIK